MVIVTARQWISFCFLLDTLSILFFYLDMKKNPYNSFIDTQFKPYNPSTCVIDVVIFAVGRGFLLFVIYFCVLQRRKLLPLLVVTLMSTTVLMVKGFFVLRGASSASFSSVVSNYAVVLVIYSLLVTWMAMLGMALGTTDPPSQRTNNLERAALIRQKQPNDRVTGVMSEARYFDNIPGLYNNTTAIGHIAPVRSIDERETYFLKRTTTGSSSNSSTVEDEDAPSKKGVMPSIPRLIVLMMAPGTGLPTNSKKRGNLTVDACFTGHSLVGWLQKVSKKAIKTRKDAIDVGQELLSQEFICELNTDKQRSKLRFADSDTWFYFAQSAFDIADSNTISSPVLLHPNASVESNLEHPSISDSIDRLGAAIAKSATTEIPIIQPRKVTQLDSSSYKVNTPINVMEDDGQGMSPFLPSPSVTLSMRSFLEEMANPAIGVPVKTYTIQRAQYSNCFSGREAANWLVRKTGVDQRKHALIMLDRMVASNILLLVAQPSKSPNSRDTVFFDDDAHLYTFCSIASICTLLPAETSNGTMKEVQPTQRALDINASDSPADTSLQPDEAQKYAAHPSLPPFKVRTPRAEVIPEQAVPRLQTQLAKSPNRTEEAIPQNSRPQSPEYKLTKSGEQKVTLESWLTANGAQDLIPILESNNITLDMLPVMGESDLRDLGVPSKGAKRLAKLIKIMADGAKKEGEAQLKKAKLKDKQNAFRAEVI